MGMTIVINNVRGSRNTWMNSFCTIIQIRQKDIIIYRLFAQATLCSKLLAASHTETIPKAARPTI